jgi:hypothetical protein
MGRLWRGGFIVLLGGAGAWLEGYGFGEADWDFAAGGELCDSAGRADCPRKRIATGTEIETYEFMDGPQIPLPLQTSLLLPDFPSSKSLFLPELLFLGFSQ